MWTGIIIQRLKWVIFHNCGRNKNRAKQPAKNAGCFCKQKYLFYEKCES